ncbi:MAG: acetolactate synthase [Mycobacterium sp.]|nr:acetolactate synthase [Mycobacterium sp.]
MGIGVIIEYLASIGVRHLFGVGGANIEDLYDAAHFRDDITAVLAKHEFSAAAMADGYSRSGAGLGVVMATSGGAALNLLAGLGESLASRVPVLALVGQPPASQDGRGSFQDTSGRNGSLDAHAVFSAVSLYCERVLDPADTLGALSRAVAAARTGGPAVVLLPKDIQQAGPARGVPPTPGRNTPALQQLTTRQDPALARFAEELGRASGHVTIIAGEQVGRDDARADLEGLRAALGAELATVPDAKDVSMSASLGVTGVMGHPGVAGSVRRSQVCLVIGTRLAATARAGLDDALAGVTILSIGAEAPHVPSRHAWSTDLGPSLRALTAALGPGACLPSVSRQLAELTPPDYNGPGVRYRQAMAVLDQMLPEGVDIVVDAGNTGASAIHYLPVRPDGRFVVALGMGGMGYSFGAAVGAAFARGRRTVVIAGDGSFFMHGAEIHTAREYGLPITFVLFNNNAHAMCVTREQLFYADRYSYNRFQPSRLGEGLAAMFPGLSAVDISEIEHLPAALEAALAVDGPTVISLDCSADERPPFAPFLNGSKNHAPQGRNNTCA